MVWGGRVVRCRTCDTARLCVQISPVAGVYQCQLRFPSLCRQLMNTNESWGVEGIPCDAVAPYPWSCGFGWCPAEGYWYGDQRCPMGPWSSGNNYILHQVVKCLWCHCICMSRYWVCHASAASTADNCRHADDDIISVDRHNTVDELVRPTVTLSIVAKRCVLEQKLLLRAYRKSYIRNRMVPKWMTLTFV